MLVLWQWAEELDLVQLFAPGYWDSPCLLFATCTMYMEHFQNICHKSWKHIIFASEKLMERPESKHMTSLREIGGLSWRHYKQMKILILCLPSHSTDLLRWFVNKCSCTETLIKWTSNYSKYTSNESLLYHISYLIPSIERNDVLTV
jgi:hypothetical protein